MEKYKSQYPTLRQAKTKWSKPSIIQKQGEGPSHGWYEMMKKDARAKLASSIRSSHYGSVSKQGHIYQEETEQPLIYHVTHTKHVAKIQKQGIMPMKTSNWVKAGDKARYGGGEVYAFTHKDDAHKWAGRMDWAHNKTLGSGKISIITAKRPADREFEIDHNDPLSQAGKSGHWMKTKGSIEPHHIVSVEPYSPKKMSEDKIGKQSPSAEEIAKKHGLTVDQVNAQLDKGVPVEREHTNSDDEAREIARDHVHEFPDYYDRLDKMEKKAKKEVNEAATKKDKRNFYQSAGGGYHPSRVDDIEQHHLKTFNKWKSDATRVGYEVTGPHKDSMGQPWYKAMKGEKLGGSRMKGSFRKIGNYSYGNLRYKYMPVKEGYDPEKEIIKTRIETHKALTEKMVKEHGEFSQQASFHRALVKRMEKTLDGDEFLKENMGVGSGAIAGMPTASPPEQTAVRAQPPVVRRKKFAGKTVFVVDPTTYHKAYLGKRKYEHYEKYLEGCDIAEEIREYGRKYWDEPIIIENEQTGAMVYLKYGSK